MQSQVHSELMSNLDVGVGDIGWMGDVPYTLCVFLGTIYHVRRLRAVPVRQRVCDFREILMPDLLIQRALRVQVLVRWTASATVASFTRPS